MACGGGSGGAILGRAGSAALRRSSARVVTTRFPFLTATIHTAAAASSPSGSPPLGLEVSEEGRDRPSRPWSGPATECSGGVGGAVAGDLVVGGPDRQTMAEAAVERAHDAAWVRSSSFSLPRRRHGVLESEVARSRSGAAWLDFRVMWGLHEQWQAPIFSVHQREEELSPIAQPFSGCIKLALIASSHRRLRQTKCKIDESEAARKHLPFVV